MGIKFTNNAVGALASSITSSATTIYVTAGQGAYFPALSAGDYFYVTLIDSSNNLEIAKVTARSADTLTVVRAQESTAGRSYSAGDKIELRITAQGMADVYGNGGVQSVAGKSGAVTLSSSDISGLGSLATKSTITASDITDGTITSAKLATTINGYGTRTVSTGTPSGGSDGDIWYKV